MVKEITDVEFADIVLQNKSVVFIDFYAPWCTTCRVLHPAFAEISDMYSDVLFVRIDVGKYSDIADKYNIMHLPTFMCFLNGKEIGRTAAANNEMSLCQFITSKLEN